MALIVVNIFDQKMRMAGQYVDELVRLFSERQQILIDAPPALLHLWGFIHSMAGGNAVGQGVVHAQHHGSYAGIRFIVRKNARQPGHLIHGRNRH